jgi:hypothetical protein
MAEEFSACRGPALELRTVHHYATATSLAVADEFTLLGNYDCAANRTDNVAVALARNF